MLPGRRGDDDGGAAGDGHRQQELAVAGVTHRPADAEGGDGRAQRQEQGDLQRAGQSEAQQGAVQGLVAEGVRVAAETHARHVVDPVRVRVVRHRRPGEQRAGQERRPRGRGGPAPAGEPQQRGEQQHGRLEGRRQADQGAARVPPPYDEAAEEDEQDGDDAGLAEPEGVADGQGEHQQADRDGRGQQRGASAHRLRQGARDDEAERGDQQQRAEGPAPAEGLFGSAGQGLEDESAERGAGEARRVVERTVDVQDAVRSDPGLQVRQPFSARGAEDDGHLADGEDRRDQPEAEAGNAQARSRRVDRRRSERFRRSSALLRIRHAS